MDAQCRDNGSLKVTDGRAFWSWLHDASRDCSPRMVQTGACKFGEAGAPWSALNDVPSMALRCSAGSRRRRGSHASRKWNDKAER